MKLNAESWRLVTSASMSLMTTMKAFGVTLRTQIEFNDPALGFQRREGLNEAIFTLKEIR